MLQADDLRRSDLFLLLTLLNQKWGKSRQLSEVETNSMNTGMNTCMKRRCGINTTSLLYLYTHDVIRCCSLPLIQTKKPFKDRLQVLSRIDHMFHKAVICRNKVLRHLLCICCIKFTFITIKLK